MSDEATAKNKTRSARPRFEQRPSASRRFSVTKIFKTLGRRFDRKAFPTHGPAARAGSHSDRQATLSGRHFFPVIGIGLRKEASRERLCLLFFRRCRARSCGFVRPSSLPPFRGRRSNRNLSFKSGPSAIGFF